MEIRNLRTENLYQLLEFEFPDCENPITLLNMYLEGFELSIKEESIVELTLKSLDYEWSRHKRSDNRSQQFIQLVDSHLHKLENNTIIGFFSILRKKYGQDFMMEVFANDTRTLAQLIYDVGNIYKKSKQWLN